MEWNKMKKYNPNGPGYPEAGYWYVLQSEAEERIEKLQADLYEGNCELEKQQRINRELEDRTKALRHIASSANSRAEVAEAKLRAVAELDCLTNAEAEMFAFLHGFDPGFVRKDELEAILKEGAL